MSIIKKIVECEDCRKRRERLAYYANVASQRISQVLRTNRMNKESASAELFEFVDSQTEQATTLDYTQDGILDVDTITDEYKHLTIEGEDEQNI
ncbi:MAG: hypothetical protein ACRDCT_25485 [Shewanella sp.]